MTPSKDRAEFWEGDVPWVSPKDMKVPVLHDSIDHVTEQALAETGLKLHPVDSVMVVTRGMILAHTFPVARNAVPVTINQDMKALRPRAGMDARYLAWMLVGLESLMLSLTDESAHGTKALRTEQWENLPIPVPSLGVQTTIANFLDAQTARIDLLIAEKERLTAILKAQMGEAIDRAVLGLELTSRAGGLQGLEVLGDLPYNWQRSRMKFELEYVTSGSRGWADFYTDEGALFIRIGNLTRDSIALELSDIQRVKPPDAAEGVRARVRAGDLLISITAYLGSVAVAPSDVAEAYVSQHVSLARPNRLRAIPAWLGYVVLSSVGRTYFDLQAYGGTKVQLSLDDIRELPLPLPTLEVQADRVQELEERLAQLRDLEAHAVAHIGRLREYRSSLISAAVTGQLDIGEFKEAA